MSYLIIFEVLIDLNSKQIIFLVPIRYHNARLSVGFAVQHGQLRGTVDR